MQKAFIIFNSITYAQLGRDVLRRYNIRSGIGRLKANERIKSCSYVLYPEGDINRAYEIIKSEGIKNLGVGRGDAP